MKNKKDKPQEEVVQIVSSSTRSWKKLEPKMSSEFKKLIFEFLVQQYLRELFKPKLSGKEFSDLFKAVKQEAKKCNIWRDYPFDHEIFQHTHPMADEAKEEARRRAYKP